jgi:hypothetical protein
MTLPATPATGTRNGRTRWILGCLVCLLLGLFIGHAVTYHRMRAASSFATPYQAVLLSNNSVYYGKLSGYGSGHPVLTDVYYILSKTNPDDKQVTNVLVKRGKELHGPDRMYLNARQIVFVEPVGAGSKVAQLISEANH